MKSLFLCVPRCFTMVLTAGVLALGCGPTDADSRDGGGSYPDGASQSDAATCAQTSAEAQLVKKPVDIIFVIDNSGSMTEEIKSVQDNINANFAQIIDNSGVDYRVIMLTHHGQLIDESVCIEAPLSNIAVGGCASPPDKPANNPPRFYHYSFYEVASHDSWCRVLERFDVADEYGLAPTGYREWLRPDAYKIFVEVTDDGVACSYDGQLYNDGNTVDSGQSAAAAFDSALLARSPTHFGTAQERNYRWYSLIALANKDPSNPAEPWLPSDPMTTSQCPTAADPGTGYQALSVLTGGLRFPLCEPSYYDVVFNEIAQGVIDGAAVACEFAIPEPPPGEYLDLATVVVEYTPGKGGPAEQFQQVASSAECVNNQFYIEDDAIKLCDNTCDRVQADDNANIDILFGCAVVIK